MLSSFGFQWVQSPFAWDGAGEGNKEAEPSRGKKVLGAAVARGGGGRGGCQQFNCSNPSIHLGCHGPGIRVPRTWPCALTPTKCTGCPKIHGKTREKWRVAKVRGLQQSQQDALCHPCKWPFLATRSAFTGGFKHGRGLGGGGGNCCKNLPKILCICERTLIPVGTEVLRQGGGTRPCPHPLSAKETSRSCSRTRCPAAGPSSRTHLCPESHSSPLPPALPPAPGTERWKPAARCGVLPVTGIY